MQNYENLNVWHKAVDFAVIIYKLTKTFPKEELYGIISQLRRACVSISLNIAEACGRNSNKDKSRILHIALGSVNETKAIIYLSHKLDYLDLKEYENLDNQIIIIRKMLINLIKTQN